MKVFAPGLEFYHDFFAPGAGVLHFLCVKGWGTYPFKKFPRVWPWGGGGGTTVGLRINRYITKILERFISVPFESIYYLYVKRLL